jgi:hypothetical protein
MPGLVVHDDPDPAMTGRSSLGHDLVVMDFDRQVAHRLAGPAAEVFRTVHRGRTPASSATEVVEGLVACGLLCDGDIARPVVGRRALISTAAAIGVTTLVLPSSSAAASEVGITGFMVSSSSPYYGVVEFTASGVEPEGGLTDYFTASNQPPRFVDDEGNTSGVVTGSVFTVPNGANTITVHAYGTSGEGASGNFTADETFGYSLGGTVSMSYAVLPGDRFQIVAGSSASGGSGATSTGYGVLRGGNGGRGVGLYKIGQDPVWVAVAGGGGGVGGVDSASTGRGPNGGSGGINTSKANGTSSAFAGSGDGGRNGVAQPGGGAAGFDGVGTSDDGGSGTANGRTSVPSTTTTEPTEPELPEMWLGDGGPGGSGGIGGGAGGSGYFGGGGGGAGSGEGTAANLGYGGGGGAGGTYVVALGLVGTPTYDWAHTPLADGPKLVIEFDLAQ